MKDLQLFNFKDQELRLVLVDGTYWWIAADVCKALDIARADSALRSLDDDEKGTHTVSTPGGNQKMLCVNESGIYHLIFTSRKKEAKVFRRWVTNEVLPSIRKTGSYSIHQNRKELSNSEIAANPELALQTLELHKTMRLAFYRSARDWQGLVNILYPEHKKSRSKSKAQPPKIGMFQGEQVTQLTIGFAEDVA